MSFLAETVWAQWSTLTNFARRAIIRHVPDACSAVARARDNEPPVARKVERVNLLLVALEYRPDPLLLDVPDLVCKRSCKRDQNIGRGESSE